MGLTAAMEAMTSAVEDAMSGRTITVIGIATSSLRRVG